MAAFKKIISLDAKVRMFAAKTMADLVFEIDENDRDTEVDLIKVLL